MQVKGIVYDVGPGAELSSMASSSRILTDDYVASPQYMALTLGALSRMKLENIDLLAVGLPVAKVESIGPTLRKWRVGKHKISKNNKVNISKVMIMQQPLGSLAYLTQQPDQQISGKSHIIDVEYQTLHWVVTYRFGVDYNRYSSTHGGMSTIL